MPPDAEKIRRQILVFWALWGSLLSGQAMLYFFLTPEVPRASSLQDLPLNVAGLAPLFVSIIVRWLVLPRCANLSTALPVFIAGAALAEACGILGLFFGGPYRDQLFVLGVLGITQYVPLFTRQLAEPKPQGFIPNN